MRICLVYDCLYPHTVGGAERWYRNLAQRLVADGHEVTYLTLRQWDSGADPGVPGVDVVAVGPRMELYVEGRRRVLPPLVFGAGVLWHLLRRGGDYDVVHTASFPYFSLLAAAACAPLRRFRIVVDWHEIWTREYWLDYLGGLGGRVGHLVQRLCVRVPQKAFCFSRLYARRLREEGLRSQPEVITGQYVPAGDPERVEAPGAGVVFAGRHIPEKQVLVLPPALARARAALPELRGEIYGDGPERARLLALIEEMGAADFISAPGFVDGEVVEHAISHALCMVLPSRREGYGLVVLEAAARGTPSVVVAGPDNAAVELVDEGVNGFVAGSESAQDLAAAIERVHAGGAGLRRSTAEWFDRNSGRLTLDSSLATVSAGYSRDGSAGP